MSSNYHKYEFVVNNFIALENQMIDILDYIPYIDSNLSVISPKFIPIILESCSLIESILKDTLYDGKSRYTFKKYAEIFNKKINISDAITVFLGSKLQFLQPFENWINLIPNWWHSYNKLKHDRLNNFHVATFETTIYALSALHQIICQSRLFVEELIRIEWVDPDYPHMAELFCARLTWPNAIHDCICPCESKIFISPLDVNFIIKEDNDYELAEDNFLSSRARNAIELKFTGLL